MNKTTLYVFSKLFVTGLAVVILLSSATGSAWAQAGAGTIAGTLTDPNGAVIPDAKVTVHNVETGIDREVTTNGAGLYTVPFLQPGTYEVTAVKPGFAKLVRKDLTVQVGQTLTVDFKMPIQSTSETVTVTGEASIVDPSKTDVSQVVSPEFVNNLPIAGRRWESFVLLTPNVTTDGGTGLISYRGISGLYNSTAVDGANNNQALFSETRGRSTVALTSTARTRFRNSRSVRPTIQRSWAKPRAASPTPLPSPAPIRFMAICSTTCVIRAGTRSIQWPSRKESIPSRSTSSSNSAAAWADRSSRTSCSSSLPMMDRARSIRSCTPAP